ncbi:MAG TPA: hypothetical protein VD884_10520, partial [Ohtaekwangia sp.]|nr:hypothetical protein [Ohtaekwangia sp.]
MFFSPPGPAGPSILALSLNMIRAIPFQAKDNVMRQYQYAEGWCGCALVLGLLKNSLFFDSRRNFFNV